MISLLWLLATYGVAGTSFDIPAWQTFLTSIDATLPWTTAQNSDICYYFDLSQTCSGDAIGTFLGQAAVANVNTWSPTPAQCTTLLDQQRAYLESVASTLFAPAIASAATAGVTNFELMAQSWVLRVGYHELTTDYSDFVTAINSVVAWPTVHCDSGNLLYDSSTLTEPAFLSTSDCNTLSSLHPTLDCTNASCSVGDALNCCVKDFSSTCCGASTYSIIATCTIQSCGYKAQCCSYNSHFDCCLH